MQIITIFKCKQFSNTNDLQIKMQCKWLCYANANNIQMIMLCKWLCYANDYARQVIMLCKWKWFANKTPSLVQNVFNKQNVKKYQMRIIFIFPRSWAWQGVEKLNSKMASLRYLQWGVQPPWLVQCKFFHFPLCKIFSIFRRSITINFSRFFTS